jgi:multidrug resistance efflux pump
LLERRTQYEIQVRAAQDEAKVRRSEGKLGEMQILLDQADKAQKDVDMVNWQIDHATIKAPLNGLVFQGDLRTKLGSPVRAGDQLFEVGQASLRAEMNVPEDQIMEMKVGQKGVFKATAYPGRAIHFSVERITPVATVSATKNVFKVRGKFDAGQDTRWLKPGVEGLAKVDVEPKRYAWIWTHRMINWVRMKLWM